MHCFKRLSFIIQYNVQRVILYIIEFPLTTTMRKEIISNWAVIVEDIMYSPRNERNLTLARFLSWCNVFDNNVTVLDGKLPYES